ncbi:unnamed protein product [Linum trigynum]|uniref:Secreted protein n=1 Tax=Linum trigynum TaxID=586398 RepID=A0AAV2CK64_9ROSI
MKKALSLVFLCPTVAFSCFAVAGHFLSCITHHAMGSCSTLAIISSSPTSCGVVSNHASLPPPSPPPHRKCRVDPRDLQRTNSCSFSDVHSS